MVQEDKELLLKDICARLPYGVKVKFYDHWVDEYEIIPLTAKLLSDTVYIGDIKPYLLPLSSMTDRQKNLFSLIVCKLDDSDIWRNGDMIFIDNETDLDSLLDFYNKNHLDWRGLIPKGLAIDATGLNIY